MSLMSQAFKDLAQEGDLSRARIVVVEKCPHGLMDAGTWMLGIQDDAGSYKVLYLTNTCMPGRILSDDGWQITEHRIEDLAF